jgi:hypothetical protein
MYQDVSEALKFDISPINTAHLSVSSSAPSGAGKHMGSVERMHLASKAAETAAHAPEEAS